MRSEKLASKDSLREIRNAWHFPTSTAAITLLCFFYLIFISQTEQPRLRPPGIYEHSIKNVQLESRNQTDHESMHTIIIWWTFSYHKSTTFKNEIQKEYTCGKYQCIFTANRSRLSKSAAVLFTHGFVHNDLPKNRLPGQRWIIVNQESPAQGKFRSNLNGKINWTLTYHRSSDIVFPYGFYKRRGSDIHYPFEVSILSF